MHNFVRNPLLQSRPRQISKESARTLTFLVLRALLRKDILTPCKGPEEINELKLLVKRSLPYYTPRSTLSDSDFEPPENLENEIFDLAYDYGEGRRYADFYPLAQGINKLPTTANAPDFGYLASGPTPVPEESPSWTNLQLEGNRGGGLIRFPREFNTGRPELIGQYLAQYVARRMAKLEDQTLFLADGTATYESQVGACKHALNKGKKITLGSGLLHATDITLEDLRNLRKQVNTDHLAESAYYLHPTFEQLLVSFNTGGNQPYVPETSPPRFDGFPVLFTGVLPVFDADPHQGQVELVFGQMQLWTLGILPDVLFRISTTGSSFNTDEFLILPIEKIDVGPRADDAVAVLQLGTP